MVSLEFYYVFLLFSIKVCFFGKSEEIEGNESTDGVRNSYGYGGMMYLANIALGWVGEGRFPKLFQDFWGEFFRFLGGNPRRSRVRRTQARLRIGIGVHTGYAYQEMGLVELV